MTKVTFNIETLLPATFGGRGIPFPGIPPRIGENHVASAFNDLPDNPLEWPELPEGLNQYSALGTRFYLPLGLKMEGQVYQLPWEPSMTISMRKTIVKTQLAGNTRRGSVKELINSDDVVMTVQGICFDHEKKGYPRDQVEMLQQLWAYNGSMEILSLLADIYEVKKVIIEDHQLIPNTGKPYTQPFIMTLISDEDFILIQD